MDDATNDAAQEHAGGCECSKEALETILLPGSYECDWPPALQAILYGLALCWMFFGAIAIVANLFMEAIEVITSKRVLRMVPGSSEPKLVLVWNPTVANLTLMALGSSLPEIMLSVVDVMSRSFFAGDLGPGTIVGSAAFNLLVILAICVSTIPDGQVRRIENMGVFVLTASISVFAYLWLWLVLTQISPNVVTLEEAVATLAFFPLLVGAAYCIDAKLHVSFGKKRVAPLAATASENFRRARRASIAGIMDGVKGKSVQPQQAVSLVRSLHPDDSNRLSDEQIAEIGAALRSKTRTEQRAEAMGTLLGGRRAHAEHNSYREGVQKMQLAALRPDLAPVPAAAAEWQTSSRRRRRRGACGGGEGWDGGGRPPQPSLPPPTSHGEQAGGRSPRGGSRRPAPRDAGRAGRARRPPAPERAAPPAAASQEVPEHPPAVHFASHHYVVGEGDGHVQIEVALSAVPALPVTVAYMTRDGTVGPPAKAGTDYVHVEGLVTFGAGEQHKTITVQLIDDSIYETDETFEVALASPRATKAAGGDPAKADFDWEATARCTVKIVDDDFPGRLRWGQPVYWADERGQRATLHLVREQGGAGEIGVTVRSADGAARAGEDYLAVEMSATLKPGQMELAVPVTLTTHSAQSEESTFTVALSAPTCGATLDAARAVATVHLVEPAERRAYQQHMAELINEQLQLEPTHATTWAEQFRSAVSVEGRGGVSMAVHVATIFWKVLFAATPPPGRWGGYPCFFCCIAWIAVVTILVSDLAVTFGCVVGIHPTVNAITLVALGTSLPDTFASKAAAVNDLTADAAIGNVTGSNCVNIFLGVGLPWFIAALKWRFSGPTAEWTRRYGAAYGDGGGTAVFVVESGALSSSVFFFMVVALACLATLGARRRLAGGELGGTRRVKHATSAFFVLLWLVFVVLSALQAEEIMPALRR